jgi:hypothetical protein
MIGLTSRCLMMAALMSGTADDGRGRIARIGDVDGFGFGDGAGFKAANKKAANVRGKEVLGGGDFLPDINQDGTVQIGNGDDFDLRSGDEIQDSNNEFGDGVTNTKGTVGSKFTDISLSKSYQKSSKARRVQVRDEATDRFIFGEGGPFPFPANTQGMTQPGFVFQFEILKEDLPGQTPIFFNMVFGDYDVSPAKIQITRKDGTIKIVNVNINARAEDGLIQAATATLKFTDVFQDGGKTWKGFLKVDFQAPQEPFTAFDYVELSTTALAPKSRQTDVETQPRQTNRQSQGRPK